MGFARTGLRTVTSASKAMVGPQGTTLDCIPLSNNSLTAECVIDVIADLIYP